MEGRKGREGRDEGRVRKREKIEGKDMKGWRKQRVERNIKEGRGSTLS